MKKILALLALSLLMVSTAYAESTVGGYQLFQGNYTSLDSSGRQDNNELLLLDTSTGKVFKYKGAEDQWVATGTHYEETVLFKAND